ncbi:MAG: glycosyltransferase family 2 protein [Crocinitomicaceae bacterium]|nr:glycosyltransferase family 2 protein [Crocinitomicaceae bacterium]
MKISILIPIFNFDVRELVEELYSQCSLAHDLKDFEILLFDDGSSDKFKNEDLANDKILYKEFSENQGRSRIRNLLAEAAHFEALLYLDCDSRIDKQDFIKAYVQNFQEGSVVYGGRTYDQNPPEAAYFLRWKYGVEREIIPADIRIQNPYQSFMTNNFLIDRKVFLEIKLDENLVGYGHEDTLLGMELKKREIPIIHIDNPAVHIGLETKEEFLSKTKEGIKNLLVLQKEGKLSCKEVKLLRYHKIFSKFPIKGLFKAYYKRKEKSIEQDLKSDQVSIRNFDLWKLNEILKG